MITAAAPSLASFGHDPIWLVIVKAVLVFAILLILTLFTIWYERRVVGRMQQRPGPNKHGPFGLLQSLADGLKCFLKEEIVPRMIDKVVFILAPIISATCAFMSFAVIPLGPTVSVFGHKTPMQLTDVPVAVLFMLAVTGLGVYGIVLSGWSSGSTYPLLGGLRATAQVISYEVAMGLSLVPVFLAAGSMSTSEIVGAQGDGWYAVLLLPSFIIYFIAVVGDTNRAPFDLPEAESELVGGYQTEYSGMRFAMFYLGEYINMITVSAIATTLFLGGWRPIFPFNRIGFMSDGWFCIIWFLIKVLLCLFVFVWLRGTLPRLRYDSFMRFGWKVLIPCGLVWLVVCAWIYAGINDQVNRTTMYVILGAVLAIAFLVAAFWGTPKQEERPPIVAGRETYPIPDLSLAESGRALEVSEHLEDTHA